LPPLEVCMAHIRASPRAAKTIIGPVAFSPSLDTAVRLSDVESGPGYVGPHGFKEVYGDYGEIAVTNRGKAIAVWGEGFSYIGPGGTWFAVQK